MKPVYSSYWMRSSLDFGLGASGAAGLYNLHARPRHAGKAIGAASQSAPHVVVGTFSALRHRTRGGDTILAGTFRQSP